MSNIDTLFRKLPPFKGKERLARLLMAGAIKNKTDVEVTGRHGCSYLLPNIIENVGFDIFINGDYEPPIQDLIFRLLPQHGCFLDLGANIGSIIVPAATRRPDIQAVGVEAAAWIFTYLNKNVEKNKLSNIRLVNKALFDADDQELDFFSPHDKYGKGSLSPVFTSDAVKVKTIRVDTLVKSLGIEKVDLIKIDVEGFEYFVFKGAAALLKSPDAPLIIFEFVDWAEKRAMNLQPGAAQQLLVENGYTLYEIRDHDLIKMDKVLTSGSYNLLASRHPVNGSK